MDDDVLQKRIGEVARAAREGLGLTQAQVAQKMGMNPGVYGRLERGGMMPSVGALRRLATALGVPPDALLDMSPEEVPISARDLSPETRKVVGLLRMWPDSKVKVGLELLRVLDTVPMRQE
jgi:transcriptional regulator with XRE-family HTH domain